MGNGESIVKYGLEAGAPVGTAADSWADFAKALGEWVESPSTLDDFESEARAFAARAVLLAGGEAKSL